MGLFSGIGHTLGHYLSESGKLAGFVPGVGPVIGGAMTAAGGLMEGDGIKDSLINGAKSGVMQYGAGKLLGHVPGVSSIADKIPGLGSAAEAAGSSGGGAAGGGGDFMGKLGSFLGGNGGNNALMLAQGANAVYNGKKAGDLSDAALQSATGAYNANAPLRDAGRAQMLHPEAGVAAKLASIPQGFNPYAAQAPAIGPAAGAPSPLGRFNPPAGGPAIGPASPHGKAFLPGGAV